MRRNLALDRRCGQTAVGMVGVEMPDANEQLLQDYFADVWLAGDPEAAAKYLHPGYHRHVSPTLPTLDRAEQIARLRGFRESFPDITVEVERVTTSADSVGFVSRMRGTHLGEFAGISPTGIKINVILVDMIRIKDGLFIEQWGGPDVYDLLRQIGAVPGGS